MAKTTNVDARTKDGKLINDGATYQIDMPNVIAIDANGKEIRVGNDTAELNVGELVKKAEEKGEIVTIAATDTIIEKQEKEEQEKG